MHTARASATKTIHLSGINSVSDHDGLITLPRDHNAGRLERPKRRGYDDHQPGRPSTRVPNLRWVQGYGREDDMDIHRTREGEWSFRDVDIYAYIRGV